jgi:NodT family efflux transporter outer membrane factor (OMF) lipoprotein
LAARNQPYGPRAAGTAINGLAAGTAINGLAAGTAINGLATGTAINGLASGTPMKRGALGAPANARAPLAIALMAAVSVLSACAVGPDFKHPQSPPNAGYTPTPLPPRTTSAPVAGGAAQQFAIGRDIQFDWWTLFQSPAINALVEQAFKANPTIESAQAALKQAQENVAAQQGYFFPTLSAGYTFQRQQLAGNLGGNSPGLQGNGTYITSTPYKPATYNFHTAQLTVGYTPDVFGGNRREVESLRAQADDQRYQLEATYITLASNVVAAALQEASTRAQIDATNQIININGQSLKILRDQFRFGYAMRIDVAAQEAALAQAKALLPPLQKQYEQTRDLIRALVGNLPNQDVAEKFELASLHLPEELPVSLPSKLVEQRPDVRAAEEQMHSASAEVGVAIANMLPQFNITAAAGGAASELGQILGPGGAFWSLGAGVTQPLFDGFTLLHRKRAAQQALIQAEAQYRSTVISAFQNVADTLHALVSDATALSAAVEAEQAAKVTLDLTMRQSQKGYVNYLTLLAAQQTYQQAVASRVQAQAMRFGDTAALYQALGGGWWHRDEQQTASR